ncbi:hypothetical protein K402DRAFT_62640 [Aulographum hederae CBS 113979]|uniref:Uncharacterized protein n=1 Tax=Aulographum hederae CBS 113979 TaxID=1176131 RepID=A0A6G1H229_9PEZI|nr:hypothetical protein K402DRAFT_62640 [Aulographum hederae CBS 113979]
MGPMVRVCFSLSVPGNIVHCQQDESGGLTKTPCYAMQQQSTTARGSLDAGCRAFDVSLVAAYRLDGAITAARIKHMKYFSLAMLRVAFPLDTGRKALQSHPIDSTQSNAICYISHEIQ